MQLFHSSGKTEILMNISGYLLNESKEEYSVIETTEEPGHE